MQPTISQVTPLIFKLKKVQNLVSGCFVKDQRVTNRVKNWKNSSSWPDKKKVETSRIRTTPELESTGVDNDYCVVIFPTSSKITLNANLRLTVCFLRDRKPDIVAR